MVYLIVSLFLFCYLSFRSNTMLTTLYAISLQASSLEVGFIVALSALFPMFLAFYVGRISDRVGYRMPLLFASFGVSIALLLPYLVQGKLFILYISQAIYGLAFIFLLINLQNIVGGLSTVDTRSRNFSIYSMGVSTAGLIGPLITGFSIDHFGFTLTYLFLSVMAAIPGLAIVFKWIKLPLPEIQNQQIKQDRVRDLLGSHLLRKALLTSGMILIGVGIYDFYFPIYGKQLGFSASIIGTLLSINAAAFLLVRFFMPVLVKRFSDHLVLIGCLFVSASAFILFPLFQGILSLGIISFLVGIGLGCGQPLSIVLAYNASPKGRTGEVLGIRLTVNKTVQFFVPIVFGTFGSIVGAFPIFWSNAVMLIVGGLYMGRKSPRKESA